MSLNQTWGNLTFNVIVGCNAFVAGMRIERGDSGSPVYRFMGSNDKLGAYAIHSGGICLKETNNCIAAFATNIDYLPVSVDPTR